MTTSQITKQQQNILTHLYQHRFLNRPQIQTFLNHKTHNRINGWLKDLYENKYIERIYSSQFGENTKPAIYSIGPNGIRFLKAQNDLYPISVRRLYREVDRSENFIARCILLANICLTLRHANDDHAPIDTQYVVTTGVDILAEQNQFHFLGDTKPHLVITKRIHGLQPSHSLVEVFDLTLPAYAIRKRLRAYFDLYAGGEWEQNIGDIFPNILIICPTVAMLISAKRFARKFYEEHQDPDDLNVWFTTVDKLKASGITGEIWEVI